MKITPNYTYNFSNKEKANKNKMSFGTLNANVFVADALDKSYKHHLLLTANANLEKKIVYVIDNIVNAAKQVSKKTQKDKRPEHVLDNVKINSISDKDYIVESTVKLPKTHSRLALDLETSHHTNSQRTFNNLNEVKAKTKESIKEAYNEAQTRHQKLEQIDKLLNSNEDIAEAMRSTHSVGLKGNLTDEEDIANQMFQRNLPEDEDVRLDTFINLLKGATSAMKKISKTKYGKEMQLISLDIIKFDAKDTGRGNEYLVTTKLAPKGDSRFAKTVSIENFASDDRISMTDSSIVEMIEDKTKNVILSAYKKLNKNMKDEDGMKKLQTKYGNQ